MNYGKKKAAKRQKQITSKSAMQAKRVGVRLFKALLLCIIVVAIAGVAGGGLFVKKIIDNSPDITPDDVKPQGFTTLVYADDGTTEIERFVAAGSNRVYKTIDEIPAVILLRDVRLDAQNLVRIGVHRRGRFLELVQRAGGHNDVRSERPEETGRSQPYSRAGSRYDNDLILEIFRMHISH